MGIVHLGIPKQQAKWLREKMNLNILVEGGTYLGETAKTLSREFERIYTIEKSDVVFEKSKKNIGAIKNIIQLRGDTREHLPKLVSENDGVLFWLDSHWSGGDTYGEQDECPLLQELNIVFSSTMKNYAILIDDARLFLAPPPLPHQVKNWPTIKQVADVIPSNLDVIIHDDVIYIAPYETGIPEYFQGKTTDAWQKYLVTSHHPFKDHMVGTFLSIVAKFTKK